MPTQENEKTYLKWDFFFLFKVNFILAVSCIYLVHSVYSPTHPLSSPSQPATPFLQELSHSHAFTYLLITSEVCWHEMKLRLVLTANIKFGYLLFWLCGFSRIRTHGWRFGAGNHKWEGTCGVCLSGSGLPQKRRRCEDKDTKREFLWIRVIRHGKGTNDGGEL